MPYPGPMGGVGHHLALEFGGPTLAAALARAVEVFGDAVADFHPSLVAARHEVEIAGSTPAALLLAVLEECLRRGREGEVAVALDDATVADGVLRGVLATVPADDPHVAASLPRVLSWHDVSLDDGNDGGWRGRVVAR